MCFWLLASAAKVLLAAESVTATTDQLCRFELVAANCAAATSVSSVPSGSESGRYPRIDRCDSSRSICSFQGPAAGTASGP